MGKIRHYVLPVFLLLMLACSPKQDPLEKVLSIREMGELATTEYTVTRIVKASDDKTWYKVGERKILMSVEATVKAGIDLRSIDADNITINGKSISILLPPPKLISLKLPPEKIKVEYQEVGVLRQDFTNAERDALLAQAEAQINRDIEATGIFQTTEKNTRFVLTRFLQQLGYENIDISFNHSFLNQENR